MENLIQIVFVSNDTIKQAYVNPRNKSAVGFRGGRFSTTDETFKAKFLNRGVSQDELIASIKNNYVAGGLEYPLFYTDSSSTFIEIVDDESDRESHERSVGFALGPMTPTNFHSEDSITPLNGDVAFLAFYKAKDSDGKILIEVDPQNVKGKNCRRKLLE